MILPSFSVDVARRANEPVLVFDIGGTWFRAGRVYADSRVELLDKQPAISIRNCDDSVAGLQRRLVGYISEVTQKARFPGLLRVAVSIGAAVNMKTGHVVASAPLWGPARCDMDLANILAARLPEFTWSVVNDVTALAMRMITSGAPPGVRRAAALTVSSGIAYRTIDLRTGDIPVDADYGLQGEIGHLPVEVFWRDRRLDARCDCGALRHVSAISSGRAIESLLRRLPGLTELTASSATTEARIEPATDGGIAGLTTAVAKARPVAIEFLELVTRPLAYALLYQMTFNPEVQFTVVSGGVAEGLGQPYMDALIRNLRQFGLYGIPEQDTGYFIRRVALGNPDGLDAIRGAAVVARGRR
jgi:2-epi-5-epi-valiolone 7-kinase